MKKLILLLLSISVAALFAGCNKKSDETTITEQTEQAAEETKDTGNSLIGDLKESTKEVAAEAEELVEETVEAVAEKSEEAVEKAEETIDQIEEAVTEEASEATTGLMGAAAASVNEQANVLTSDLADKASSLLSEYTGKVSSLSGSVKELEPLIEQAAGALSPQLTQSYNELKTLLPELSTMVASLKDYQGTDLANVTSKIQTDYTEAEALYKRVLELMP
jgi:hypothetical protein